MIEINKKARPLIALIPDIENWALANIAEQLNKHLSRYYEFRIIPMSTVNDIIKLLYMVRDCDLVHFFWRGDLLSVFSPNAMNYYRDIGITFNEFRRQIIDNKPFSISVNDHLYLDDQSLDINEKIFSIAANYYVCSKKLYDIYCGKTFCPKPMAVLEDGVDTALFSPRNTERLNKLAGRKLIVGWSGNSKWCSFIEDFKGVNTVLKPALKQLQDEGRPVDFHFADRSEGMIPHDQMPEYYSKIDLYVCTSKIEGTPNPVMEAMACGVPVISTDVGVVPQVFGEKQKEFILKERSIECLKEAIIRLLENPHLLTELSHENLMQIKDWDWSIKAAAFKDYFDRCLSGFKRV